MQKDKVPARLAAANSARQFPLRKNESTILRRPSRVVVSVVCVLDGRWCLILQVLKLAKGFRGRAKNCIRIARERVEKALQYSYRDRRNKKRDMRSLWIQRINAGSTEHGVSAPLGFWSRACTNACSL